MRTRCLAIVIAILFSFKGGPTDAQQTSTSSTSQQAATLFAQSAAALSGSTTVSDVTLTGAAQSIVGSDDESGTVSMKAMAPGESRIDLALSASSHSEVRTIDANGNLVGVWFGADAVQHAIPYHNLWTDSSWFFPALTLSRVVSNTAAVETYIGQETLNGQAVLHVSVSQPPAFATPNVAELQHLTQMDFYLDPTTFLPVALSFNTHPDNTELIDFPVQILFSNYQTISGVQVPFHIQKFTNGCLSLDLQVQSALLNSGLSPSGFGVQASQ
jgi:hypothetical protein